MKYIELFSGIGGFRNAADHLSADTKIKFKCVGFSEIDSHSLKTYFSNYKINGEFKLNDITKFAEDKKQINLLPDFDLLLGGFPCQSFSILGKKLGLEDERGKILFSINKIIKKKKPEFIVLENVRNIIQHNSGNTLNEILNFFQDHKYRYTNYVILDTQNFGLPQRRSRIFFVCSKRPLEIDLTESAVINNFHKIKRHSLQMYNNVLDILRKDVDPKYYLSERIKCTILDGGTKNFWSNSQIDLDIARTLTATMVKWHRACQDNYYSDDFILNGESHKNTPKEKLFKIPIRRLTPTEALQLQGFSKEFFERATSAGVSEHQIYKQAGNALSVNTGYALLHYLFVNQKIQNY